MMQCIEGALRFAVALLVGHVENARTLGVSLAFFLIYPFSRKGPAPEQRVLHSAFVEATTPQQ